jgi:16S rRNA C1402 N4-methylase RsmH
MVFKKNKWKPPWYWILSKQYPVLLKEIISIITPQHGGTFMIVHLGQGGYTKKNFKLKKYTSNCFR